MRYTKFRVSLSYIWRRKTKQIPKTFPQMCWPLILKLQLADTILFLLHNYDVTLSGHLRHCPLGSPRKWGQVGLQDLPMPFWKIMPHVSCSPGFRPKARKKLGERRALEPQTSLHPGSRQSPRSPRDPQPQALHHQPQQSPREVRRRLQGPRSPP